MLLTLTTEDAIAYAREDGREEGGEKGHAEATLTIARNALTKGMSIEVVHEITGLDMTTIRQLTVSQ